MHGATTDRAQHGGSVGVVAVHHRRRLTLLAVTLGKQLGSLLGIDPQQLFGFALPSFPPHLIPLSSLLALAKALLSPSFSCPGTQPIHITDNITHSLPN